jgi:hypothetical protein
MAFESQPSVSEASPSASSSSWVAAPVASASFAELADEVLASSFELVADEADAADLLEDAVDLLEDAVDLLVEAVDLLVVELDFKVDVPVLLEEARVLVLVVLESPLDESEPLCVACDDTLSPVPVVAVLKLLEDPSGPLRLDELVLVLPVLELREPEPLELLSESSSELSELESSSESSESFQLSSSDELVVDVPLVVLDVLDVPVFAPVVPDLDALVLPEDVDVEVAESELLPALPST